MLSQRHHQSSQLRTGFFSRFITKPTQQTPNQPINTIIQNNLNDWPLIFELADTLANNPDQQSKSIKAIRNYFKYQSNYHPLILAIRLTVILLLNSSDQFRLLAARKLIKPIQDVFNKASKSPMGQPVQEIIIKAFAVLGFEFQHHDSLSVFTSFYNKIRPEDAPENGTPLVESDGLFAPIPANQTSHQSQSHLHVPSYPNGLDGSPFTLIRDVRTEAKIARNNARMLLEALAFASPSEMDSNQIIQEFYSNCITSQKQLLDDIPWATEQAAQARENLTHQHQQQIQLQQAQLAANSDFRPIEPTNNGESQMENTREEQLLDVLLSANTELTAAFQQYDELARLAREEKEFKAAEERSKLETRFNRDSHGWLATQSNGYPQQAGSSNPSPRQSPLPDPASAPAGSTEDIRVLSHKGYEVPDHHSSPTQSIDKQFRNPELRRESPHILNNQHPHPQESEGNSSPIVTTIERSEKSLGKMRRISNGILPSSDPSGGALDILQHQPHSLNRFEGSNHSSCSDSSSRRHHH